MRALLVALSSDPVDLESLLPDVWIAAHPEHVLQYRRDEAEAAANTRRRRRALRRKKTAESARPLVSRARLPDAGFGATKRFGPPRIATSLAWAPTQGRSHWGITEPDRRRDEAAGCDGTEGWWSP